ncbi:MAG: hypothetical protein OXC26_08335 [Albidovulum sp.]|nr:hypothetical protein [Albidovulum sp.]
MLAGESRRPRGHGGADGRQVFVLEFKMAEGEGDANIALDAAIAQWRDRGYAEKHRDRGEPVHLVGAACGREARNLRDQGRACLRGTVSA